MDILVKVSYDRKCFASVDWNSTKGLWVMSFGDLEKPDHDVEIEFTPIQLSELRGMLNGMDMVQKVEEKPKVEKVASAPTNSQTDSHRGLC